MVHYRREFKADSPDQEWYPIAQFPGRDYWKLAAHGTEESRVERGFLDYDQCTLDELRRFCKQRQLIVPSGHDGTFDKFKEILQAADEVAIFNRFLDLPPELRLHIYEIYKAPLDFNHFSVAPPITFVSKLIRRAASSLFFRERLFLIHRDQFWPPPGPMSLQRVTQLFWNRAPLAFIHSLRKLEIMAPLGHGAGYAEFDIDLNAKQREERACFVSMGTFNWVSLNERSPEVEVVVNGVVEQLRELVDVILAREPGVFERGDADAVLKIFAATAQVE
ncbi:hypothetical protein CLAFUW4_07969 [Fulvia fulva]|uniref:F-box domain-containing protein n=1 Tax=Passalora fulva TaxID=5499 RepID=A0A9Q8P6H8_PASFU|nr:uncharacterized protein CLAFUR5_08091 [Fulvia fulva]KAK4628813.1 hypothetical protein CLAFUR4_07974 [Fulvia fulva]KAK4630467.1 hypothetical protein CLAFUR0_07971 [Fulvia fulva]UJO15165.1 hypothetical protein CLAFUR5_08091 [Fulvia fulva]WPV12625.1 hypothetical protein CLAFUW4_07969 [Fulvia fulva]WPV27226.1 hypothetical protein CLAFUW7_07970 [Fulvia fulva]